MKQKLKIIVYFISAAALAFGCAKKETEDVGNIYGVITDKATGEPVRTAGVHLSPTGLNTVTGNEGQYEFTNLSAGEYTLNVTKTGYTDLVNYKISVAGGKTNKGDVQLEKLPPSLRVVNDSRQDISELDFGSATSDVSRSFNIFNDGPESLEWQLTETAEWITGLSKSDGTLRSGATQAVMVTIDRNKLENGENTATIYVTSDNGSWELTVKAIGEHKILPVLNTLAVTEITVNAATLNGEIMEAGLPSYTERGFVYGVTHNPTIGDINATKISVSGSGAGIFSANITALTTDQLYYLRAYATNGASTVYGDEVSFIPHIPNVVILLTAGLMVQKTDITGDNPVAWNKGNSLCESSTLDGYTDWRLPTLSELAILYYENYTIGGFVQSSGYWSSTSDYKDTWWWQNFSNGQQGTTGSTSNLRCRCVRNY
jgi:hypothetical protein